MFVQMLSLAVVLVPQPRELSCADGVFRGDPQAAAVVRNDASVPPEGYRLDVTPSSVTIVSSDAAGAFYARETLKQLAVAEGPTTNCPCVRIVDSPKYLWRGVLIDEGRHFFGADAVKKMIKAMACHKLNTLHWHLTEDQGWRIDFKKWPELAKWGSARSESPIRGTHNLGDGRPYGPYFYTEEEIAEIVEFAEAHHVKIVPEIELPGHSRAALAAYPQFSCLGDKLERRPDTTWGVKRELYCAGNDDAIAFLESVLDETCRLFRYSDTIHIGGDECPKTRWKACPKCQARIRALGLKDEESLQSWVTGHFTAYLSKKGKRVVGWDEILAGGLPKGTTIMSWRGMEGACAAASNGLDTVVCPRMFTYLDQAQKLPDDPWRAHAGGLSLEKVYGFDPAAGIPENQRHHILGSQGLLWSESITNPEELMWMGFPRLSAVAEVLWTGDPKRDYGEFTKRLKAHIPRLRAMGVNSAPIPEEVSQSASMKPVPNTQAVGYDWRGRHDYIVHEQPSWRAWPRVVLIGDSIAHFWSGRDSIGEIDDSLTLPRWKAAFAGISAMNMGFASDRTQNLIWRLENGALKNVSPYLIVLMIGRENLTSTPELAASTPEETAQAVRKIVGILCKRVPAAEILLMGVLPCAEARSPLRGRIAQLNRLLARIPSYGYDGKVRYLDIGERFLGANGEIPRALMPDLVHPSDDGYAIWATALKPYLARVLERIAAEKENIKY